MKPLAVLLALCVWGCGFYTLSGSSLPGYLKTVSVPLFVNNSLEPGVADDITLALTEQVNRSGLLKTATRGADATLRGEVVNYQHQEYNYSIEGNRQATIQDYIVRVTAAVTFFDNHKDTPLFEGTLTGEGIYDFSSETEQIGRDRAISNLIEQIMNSSVQSW